MKTRLTAFVVALLFLPPLALSLAGRELDAAAPIAGALWLPALLATLAVLVFGILLDALTFRRTRHSLLHAQRGYLLGSAIAGAGASLLLAYLNLFAGAWFTPAPSDVAALLLAAFCGAVVLPVILITRLWLGSLPGLVRLSARRFALPAVPAEVAAKSLLLAALIGLLVGTIQIQFLSWLFWLSPLLLLLALQLLWHESSIFSGLVQGDWSRVLLAAASGIMVGSIALAAYRASGGTLYLNANSGQLLAYLALFGLLCLQLGDVVAEHWRGKTRGDVFKKKPFPIPIVTKKDQ